LARVISARSCTRRVRFIGVSGLVGLFWGIFGSYALLLRSWGYSGISSPLAQLIKLVF
jgi:hypothetical protein